MRIVAIDFETANNSPVSAISLGIVEYENGEILNSEILYFCPPFNHDHFIYTYIHHLTYNDVKNAPSFNCYYKRINELLSDAIVVAHNASFDINVLNAVCDYYLLERISFKYLDTVKLARRTYPYLVNHRLNTICNYLKIDLNHHEALSDAMACLMIVLKVMENKEIYDLDDLLQNLHMKYQHNL